MGNKHDLPCWNEECGGESTVSFYLTPKPHLNCFKCEKQKWSLTEEEIEYYTLMNNTYQKTTFTSVNKSAFPKRGVSVALQGRAISKETALKYEVECIYDTDKTTPVSFVFPVKADGTLIAQKEKFFDKKMLWLYEGDAIPELSLFGQHLFPSGGKYLTITEGEEDCLAAYEMLKENSPSFEPAVVSLMFGVAGAEKECQRNWEYINSFENIILCFDGDDVGREAARKVARLFNYKPKIVLFSEAKKKTVLGEDGKEKSKWLMKDANDYKKAGKEKDFIRSWWKAERETPKGVVTFKGLWDSMCKTDTNITVPYPWPGLNEKLHGLTTGHFVVVKAPPKIGKTSILKELTYHILTTSPHNVGLIFLENTKKEIGVGLCSLHLNKVIKPWDIPDNIDDLAKAHEELSKEERLMVFDPEDERSVDNVIAKILYFVKAHNCKFVFLDHITMLSYQSEDDNERRFLDKLCADLKKLTTSQDICIIAVTHVNDDGKTRGSRASVQLCDSMISLERDKTNRDSVVANTTDIVVEDNRWGECGLACSLYYDKETGRMTELDKDLSMDVGSERRVQFDE